MITPLIALIGACAYSAGHSAQHMQLHDDQDNHHWHLAWITPACKVDWTSDGEVWYSDNGKDVARLSPGAMLTVIEQDGPHTRRVEFYQKGGMLDRTYMVDGVQQQWDGSAADWFADLLVQVDHTTGMLASVRFPAMMANGGPSAVINDLMDASDAAKRAYMKKLINSTKLNADQSCQVATLAEHMNSDYERTELLIDVADQIDFASPTCRQSYFNAVNGISGDYDRSRALTAAIEHGPKSGPGLDAFAIAAITSAREISSDHEKAHVLVTLASRSSTADTVRTAYLTTARTIASDTERARALTALIRQQ
jgi:hypothetical protein